MLKKRPLLFVVIALGLLASGALAQQDRRGVIEPRQVRAIYGSVVQLPAPIQLYPLAPVAGTNKVFTTIIPRKGILKLRFRVVSPAQTNTWYVRILKGQRIVDAHAVSPDGTSPFWSEEKELLDDPTVEVYCFDENCSLQLEVDAVAEPTFQSVPQAITTPPPTPQLKTYRDLGQPIKGWGRAVVKIRLSDTQDLFSCTGFLVSPDLLITNNHCIYEKLGADNARVEFDFESQRPSVSYKFERLLVTDRELDFSLLRLRQKWTDREPLRLASADLSQVRKLLIIQHPKGLKKRVAEEDCNLQNTDIINVGSTRATDFGHSCDTYGGSSGSPVQDISDGRVIGLHHFEFFPDDRILLNRAVKMSLIIDCLKSAFAQSNPAILDELHIENSPPASDVRCSPYQ